MLNNRFSVILFLLSCLVVLILYLPGCAEESSSACDLEETAALNEGEEAELMEQKQFDLKDKVPPLDQAVPSGLKTATLAMG